MDGGGEGGSVGGSERDLVHAHSQHHHVTHFRQEQLRKNDNSLPVDGDEDHPQELPDAARKPA